MILWYRKNSLDDRAYEVEREESRMIMDGKDLQTVHQEIQKKRDEIATEMNQLAKTFIQDNYEMYWDRDCSLCWVTACPIPS